MEERDAALQAKSAAVHAFREADAVFQAVRSAAAGKAGELCCCSVVRRSWHLQAMEHAALAVSALHERLEAQSQLPAALHVLHQRIVGLDGSASAALDAATAQRTALQADLAAAREDAAALHSELHQAMQSRDAAALERDTALQLVAESDQARRSLAEELLAMTQQRDAALAAAESVSKDRDAAVEHLAAQQAKVRRGSAGFKRAGVSPCAPARTAPP